MSNTSFQIGTIYSNIDICALRGENFRNHMSFYIDLYKGHPEDCPWPKSQALYKKLIEKYEHGMIDYIVPFKRTNCYLTFKSAYGYITKKKIRIDEDGNEYIMYEGRKVSASDYTPDTIKEMRSRLEQQRMYDTRYIKALEHLEEYGYVYLSNLDKVESIEALDEVYDKVSLYEE